MSEKALVPIEQKMVEFYDDQVLAIVVQIENTNQVFVPVRPIAELLGLDWSAQSRRLRRDAVLSKVAKGVAVTATPGGRQEMLCLPLDFINGWLFGINANRVKAELRDRVILYQEKCYKVLAEAFQEGRLATEPTVDDLLAADTPAAQAYRVARAVMTLARQQVFLESKLDDHDLRLERLEEQLGDPGRHITPEQASQISQAVKAVAMLLTKRSGASQYGAVYGELYRKFGITSYKMLPAAKFDEAMKFLTDWHGELTGDTPF